MPPTCPTGDWPRRCSSPCGRVSPSCSTGEGGVGKTEAAKAVASALSARLIRLRCYESLDVAHAVYEWNYSRQLLRFCAAQDGHVSEDELFGPQFLIRRPLLEAIESPDPVVLLIDEINPGRQPLAAGMRAALPSSTVSCRGTTWPASSRLADVLAAIDRRHGA